MIWSLQLPEEQSSKLHTVIENEDKKTSVFDSNGGFATSSFATSVMVGVFNELSVIEEFSSPILAALVLLLALLLLPEYETLVSALLLSVADSGFVEDVEIGTFDIARSTFWIDIK